MDNLSGTDHATAGPTTSLAGIDDTTSPPGQRVVGTCRLYGHPDLRVPPALIA